MDPEERRRLDKMYELIKDMNEKVNKLYRGMVWRRIFTVFYWIVIIGIAVGAFYFLRPYVENLNDMYETLRESISAGKEMINPAQTGAETQ